MEYVIEFEVDGQCKLDVRNEFHKALVLASFYDFWIISVGRHEGTMYFPLAIIARSADFSARYYTPQLQYDN